MINILHNSSFYQSMEPFKINDLDDLDDHSVLLMKEDKLKLDCTWDTYQDLIDKYITLHETYAKELENSKKIKKSLAKCLKFYSKLCKKYEAQQKIINKLEENIKQKIHCLEESLKSQEKMKGLIQIYKSERSLYSKESSYDLKRDKEILLDICCKLIGESVKTNNIRSLTNLILRKFKKDLDYEKLNLLKSKDSIEKSELGKVKDLGFAFMEDIKPSYIDINFSNKEFIQLSDVDYENKTKEEKKSNGDHMDLPMIEKEELKEPLESTDHQSNVLIKENLEHNVNNSHIGEETINDIKKKNVKDITTELDQQGEKLQLQEDFQNKLLKVCDLMIDENKELEFLNPKVPNFINEKKDEILNILRVDLISNNVLGEENDNFRHSSIEEVPTDKMTEHNGINSNHSEVSITDSVFQDLLNVSDVNQKLFDISNISREISNDNSQSCDKSHELLQDGVKNAKKLKTPLRSLFDIPEVAKENHNVCLHSPPVSQYCSNESSSAPELKILLERFSNGEKNFNSKENSHVGKLSFNSMLDSDLLSDEELSNIFNVMSTVKRLSPIRETKCTARCNSAEYCPVLKPVDTGQSLTADGESRINVERKRNYHLATSFSETSNKHKKLKSNLLSEVHETEKKDSCDLLDSIISAMSVQNEKFKSKTAFRTRDESPASSDEVKNSELEDKFTSLPLRNSSPKKEKLKQAVIDTKEQTLLNRIAKIDKDLISSEKVVSKEIKNFVSLPISTKEDAQVCVQRCVSTLVNKSEEVVAKSIVAIVLENVSEDVKTFERPAPPLTETEHRLMVLISVFNTLDTNCDKIISIIMTKISEKLFPDVSFWPDASVEAACRFYTALCRKQNDVQSLLKFFLKAMTDMKLRCFLAVFTALKTWPDILQNASTLRDNILAVTIVNIFLHMPKTNAGRNYGRVKKLLALKHLLMNFYGFTMDESIEAHGKKVLVSFLKEEVNSEKALILLCSAREWNWIKRNIIPEFKKILMEWAQGKLRSSIGIKILSVMKHICSFFEETDAQANEIISYLSQVLNCGKLEHTTELTIIELLLEMKQFVEARKIIGEWVPKCQISESLRNEIIEVSAENVLRKIKPKNTIAERHKYRKLRKQGKGKKKKAKNCKKMKDHSKITGKETASNNFKNYF